MKGKMNIVGMMLVIGVFAFLALGSGESSDPATTVSGNKSVAVSEVVTVFKVGDTIVKGDVQLVVSKVERSQGSEYDKPKTNNEYIIVYLAISNIGDENISYNPYDYKLKNGDGQLLDGAFSIIDTDTALGSGDLVPGGKVEGTLIFETKKDDSNLVLQYYSNIFASDAAIEIKLS